MKKERENSRPMYCHTQAKAIYENIGYPDYLASDNNTQLEKMYAEVRIKFVTEDFLLALYSYRFSISSIRPTFATFL